MRCKLAYTFMLLSCVSLATPVRATDLDKLNAWITSNKPWKTCPTQPSSSAMHPFFAFNNAVLNTTPPLGTCVQDGPFDAQGAHANGWWVQVITNLRPNSCTGNSCLRDLIRVCSVDRRQLPPPAPPPPPAPGPCGSTNGVGPGGCEVCAVPAP